METNRLILVIRKLPEGHYIFSIESPICKSVTLSTWDLNYNCYPSIQHIVCVITPFVGVSLQNETNFANMSHKPINPLIR